MNETPFTTLISAFSQLEQVEAILLAGSRGANTADALSDYDVYVYVTAEIPVAQRQAITDRTCSSMELNNQFWETEDDGVLLDGPEIELIYRSLDWLDGQLEQVLLRHQASTGYTTCFWANLRQSAVLYDRFGRAQALQQKYNMPYPRGLQEAIIGKNYPLLRASRPAYYHQLEKAAQRHDLVALNHRTAEFLASYFDILFALNGVAHPGEKRLLDLAEALCPRRPAALRADVTRLLAQTAVADPALLQTVNTLVDALDELLPA